MNIPPVAIGAIIVAVITGFISLLGLNITKEQKVSEFRQRWVDSLRHEVSHFAAQVTNIVDYMDIKFEKEASKNSEKPTVYTDKEVFFEFMSSIRQEIREAERLYYKIILHLNPGQEYEKLRQILVDLNKLFFGPDRLSG